MIAACVFVYFFVQHGQIDLFSGATDRADRQEEAVTFNFQHAAIPEEVVSGEPLTVREVAESVGAEAINICHVPFRSTEFGQIQVDQSDAQRECFPNKNVWLALVSSMFLHAGLLHLGGNMLFLWVFGNNVEDRLGVFKFLLFYALSGIVASGAHILVQPHSAIPVLGASGAIAGVMGAYLVWFPNVPIRTLIIFFLIFIRDIEAKWLLGFWFVLQFFTNPNEGVAWVAHVGGFVFGVLVALLMRTAGPARPAVLPPDRAPPGGFRSSDDWRW